MNNKNEVREFLEYIKQKIYWFYGADIKIVDNNLSMHMIVRTEKGFKIPSREETDSIYYFLREIFDKATWLSIDINDKDLLEYWFVFENLEV